MIPTLLWLAASCGPQQATPTSPTFLDLGPGAPRVCLPDVPEAGRLRRDEEAWKGAAALLHRGDAEGATAMLAEAGDHPGVTALHGVIAIVSQDGPGSWETLRPLAEAWPQDPCLGQVAGIAAWSAGDPQAALALVERASQQRPADPELSLLRGLLLIELGRRDEAAAGMEAALTANPDHVSLSFAVGILAFEEQDLERAVPLLERAMLGGMPLQEDMVRLYHRVGRRADYLRLASALTWPLNDDGALAAAEDPEAAYLELVGLKPGEELVARFVTSEGTLQCQLLHEESPVTVANFVGLARGTHPWLDATTMEVVTGPYYDGTALHRIIPDFMIQGGDRSGTGSGGPGYHFADEVHPELRFDRAGVLAMANSGPDSNGSQWFITEAPAGWLNGSHTIFGRCDEDSTDLVGVISRLPRGRLDRPIDDVIVEGIEVVVRPMAPGTDGETEPD